MKKQRWYKKLSVIWMFIIVFPPLGLVLLWMRRESRLLAKVIQSLMVIVFTVVHLIFFWGFGVEMDGGLTHPRFVFRDLSGHYKEIEERHDEGGSIDASRMQADEASAESKFEPESELPGSVSDNVWTEYRGPGRNGVYTESEIITDWLPQGLPLIWKRPVGGGYASVVVADGAVFTIEQRRGKEVVAAYDLESGREIWIHGWDAEFKETLGGNGPRATPTWDEGRLYALGAEGELRCLEAATGKRIWSCNILKDNQAENLQWGMAASPLIVDDKVVVLPGGRESASIVAYDKLTGNPVWKALSDKTAYTAPQLAILAGRRQILVVGANRAIGLLPEDGSLLWEFPWVTSQGINIAQPLVTTDNRFFISAGYGHGAALVEITASGGAYKARAVWQNKRMKNKFASPVLYQGYIYGLDEAILACMDASTGELKWKGGRYGYGQVLLASGYLIISSEAGEVALVKATPEKHLEISRFKAIDGKTWNVPAIADGKLIVRNQTEMACFQIGK
jgi:outer membrane protein assembly factor BamB